MCIEVSDLYHVVGRVLENNMSLDVNITHTDDNKYYFCISKEEDIIVDFKLYALSGNEGFFVSEGLFVNPKYRGMGYAQLVQKIKITFAKKFGVNLLCVISDHNFVQEHILLKFGWKLLTKNWYTNMYMYSPF